MNARVFAASAVLMALSISTAWSGPIEDRQALMKANGRAVGTIAPMVQGKQPFDAAAAKAALEILAEDGKKLDADVLFPPGSDKGETKAGPNIWTDRAAFVAATEKFRADTAAAAAANPQTLDELKPLFTAIAQNCSGCHQTFRVK